MAMCGRLTDRCKQLRMDILARPQCAMSFSCSGP